MKIVYLYTALITVGGADRVITEKANYLAEKYGHEVYIITDSQCGLPPVFPISPKVHHIDLDINFFQQYEKPVYARAFIYFKLMRIYKKKLSQLLDQIRPDITITTMGRDMDFLTSLNDGSKKITEAHVAKHYLRNLHLMEEKGGVNKLGAKIWRRKMEKIIPKFDSLVVLTQNDADSWKGMGNVTIIPNSLPFYPDESSTLENKKAITVGRFYEQKGIDMLIDAWAIVYKKHPDWEISVYGNGELKEQLEAQIKANGIEKVFLLKDPVSNIVDKYLESSIYVMSSRFEGFGMVLTEAMACGVPCISFDCPHGPSEIIKDKEDGMLVNCFDVQQLADSICYLIEHKEERKQMGHKAKENVTRYSADVIMQKWADLFKSLTAKKG